ncbi:hypothetical protein GCM10027190_13040 [Spirosoma areae]
MKLLLDQNISFRVVKKLKEHFPIVEGVRENGLYDKDDRAIWEFCVNMIIQLLRLTKICII